MWIAVVSLSALGASHATVLAAEVFEEPAGWGFYPNSLSKPPPTIPARIRLMCYQIQTLLYPIAPLASAAYIITLERDQRRKDEVRGFDVNASRAPD